MNVRKHDLMDSDTWEVLSSASPCPNQDCLTSCSWVLQVGLEQLSLILGSTGLMAELEQS